MPHAPTATTNSPSIKFYDRHTTFSQLKGLYPPETQIILLNQVHGSEVLVIEESKESGKPMADAVVTRAPNVALTIHTADCLPLLAHDGNGVLGACHAGWKGLSQNVIENWIAKMGTLGAKKEKMEVAIGPSIGPCHFEVGKDVAAKIVSPSEFPVKFLKTFRLPHPNPQKEFVDLRAVARFKLLKLGLRPEALQVSEECTYCLKDRYFSYRRGDAGRNESVIVKSPS